MRRLLAVALTLLAFDASATTFKRGVAAGGGTAATASTLIDDIACPADGYYRRNPADNGWICSTAVAGGYSLISNEGGAALTGRTTINFIGTAVDCVDGGTRTDCTITGGGAPTAADYLVGTADGTLSNEIVVGTTPGGELGNTWASPTIDDGISITNLTLVTPALGTPASGVMTNVTGIPDGALVNNYSGVGACGANTFASTLNDNAAPTCTQPSFANLSGTITAAQTFDDNVNSGRCLVSGGAGGDPNYIVCPGGGVSTGQKGDINVVGADTDWQILSTGADFSETSTPGTPAANRGRFYCAPWNHLANSPDCRIGVEDGTSYRLTTLGYTAGATGLPDGATGGVSGQIAELDIDNAKLVPSQLRFDNSHLFFASSTGAAFVGMQFYKLDAYNNDVPTGGDCDETVELGRIAVRAGGSVSDNNTSICVCGLETGEASIPAWRCMAATAPTAAESCVELAADEVTCLGTGGCTGETINGTGHSFMTANFATGADSAGSWTFRVPAGWTTPSTVAVHIEWLSDNAACDSSVGDGGVVDDVCWQFDSGSVPHDGAFKAPTLGGTANGQNSTCLANGDLMRATRTGYVHGLTDGQLGIFVLTRDVTGTPSGCASEDDYLQDAKLLSVRICKE